MKTIPISPDARAFEAQQYEAGSILDDVAEIGRLACAGTAGVPSAGSVLTDIRPLLSAGRYREQYEALLAAELAFDPFDDVAGVLRHLRALVSDRFVAARGRSQ